jgi:predicted RNase H-like nuclease (RuvC/YqgF family)
MMEEYESSDGIAAREFKRLRNVIRTQSAEISELKSELEQHDDQITSIEIVNQDLLAVAGARINKLVDENNELKAQILSIKRLADGLMGSNSGIDYSGKMDGLLDAIDKVPPQCLASVKADAVKDFMQNIQYCEEDELINQEGIDESFDFWNESRNKLQEQK